MAIELPLPNDAGGIDRKALLALIRRAEKGDDKAFEQVRPLLDQAPEAWRIFGELDVLAEAALRKLIAGNNRLHHESLRRRAAALRAELGGAEATPLERLLVDRVVACWLQVNHADALAAQNFEGVSLRVATYYEERQGRAQRRYLAAVRTLAQVRRLGLPTVQVNIAEKQVNVVQSGSRDESS